MSDKLQKKERLASLDILRGLDIFFLTVLTGVLFKLDRWIKLPKWLLDQLIHPAWEGFTAYDMIMPLFIFMCGAALPLALPRYLDEDGKARSKYIRHVLSRSAMLWVTGMAVQGELLSFDLHRISFFNNTLQTIAVGYLAAAAVFLIKRLYLRIAIPFLLAFVYTLFLHCCGDMTPTGNAAVIYEVKFLSLFYPDASWHPVKQISDWHYTWWTTLPMFAVMGLCGSHATSILKTNFSKAKKACLLAGVGAALLLLGAVFSTFDPVVKHIFTASFTSFAMGVSFLLYAICYWLFDILQIRRGTYLLTLFGRHSLFAYVGANLFGRLTWVVATLILTGATSGPGFPKGLSRFMSPELFGFVLILLRACVLALAIWFWHDYTKRRAESRPLS